MLEETMNDPSWTDITQTIVSIIGLFATIIGVIVLLSRDKNKEIQIEKLSEISENLSKMISGSELRYINSLKPRIFIRFTLTAESKTISLIFKNSNKGSSIRHYDLTDVDEMSMKKYPVTDSDGSQVFEVTLTYREVSFDPKVVKVNYITSEGHKFTQTLIMWVHNGGFYCSPSTITYDKEY